VSEPLLGIKVPDSIFINVDFPEPFQPMIPRISPFVSEMSMGGNIGLKPSNDFEICCAV
jgi:hypothetical protein